MPSSYTPNYNLNQWEADDRVQRTDFNADNAKIDAALSGFSDRLALLERAVPNLGRYVGFFGLQDILERKKTPSQWAMACETFLNPTPLTLSSGVTVNSDHVLTLSGKGATGTMRSPGHLVDTSGWTQARMWLHHKGRRITPKLNGGEMEAVNETFANSATGVYGFETEYVWNGVGSKSAQITLELNCEDSSISVYDYVIMFF